jgi:predicted NBD/HSP70 family sugar kinase
MDRSGLSRSAVSHRLEVLLERDLVTNGEGSSTGGRPPSLFEFNSKAGVVLVGGLGATHSRIAVMDLSGAVIVERAFDLDISDGPEAVLGWVEDQFGQLLRTAKSKSEDVRGIGIGIPAPVEAASGKPVSPPIMPGWDGYAIPERLGRKWAVPVLVDNDVNVMALGEQRAHYPDIADLLFVKVGTGIGCGIVAAGQVLRGADGSAGDIGHVPIAQAAGIPCSCGNAGCLEAVASGSAMAQRLRAEGLETQNARDVVRLVRAGDVRAIALVRESGRLIGEALASAVNLFNPRVIVVGGDIAQADQHLLPGIKEFIYQRSLALSTQHLRIVRSRLNDRAEIAGAATMVIDHILLPEVVDRVILA